VIAGCASRVVVPEILDHLDFAHPDARRSRLDLRGVDFFLGGTRWIVGSAVRHAASAAAGIVELGAGEGRLCNALARRLPGCPVTGLDFAVPGCPLAPGVSWTTGDFFQTLSGTSGGIAVGSLILHHFEREALRCLGELLRSFRVLIFSEPLRHPWPLVLARLIRPLTGTVTRHDMPVSIRAGFRAGELGPLLGLDAGWKIVESSKVRGAMRFEAWRG
jgi:hypothetical protein